MTRHLLSVADLSAGEIGRFLDLTAACKRGGAGLRRQLAGKAVALLFEKASTRTRLATEVACGRLGAQPVTIADAGLQIGRGETIEDTARIFSRFVDAVCWRTTGHDRLEVFAKTGTIPVINTLSDREHPTQILADLFTIRERMGAKAKPAVAFIGDGGNNVAHSWMFAAAILGLDFRLATPPGYPPDATIRTEAAALARRTGARLLVTADPGQAAKGADVLYTDVWVSMGQETERMERLREFRRYRLDAALLAKASSRALVMHCLPAHRGEEITEEVLEGTRSVVWEQAENRLYNAMAALLWVLKGGKLS